MRTSSRSGAGADAPSDRPRAAGRGTGTDADADALYCYGFVAETAPSPPDDLVGVAGRPVETVELSFGRAAVSRVPADAYAADVVEARLRDPDWLAEQGLAHERVVTWFVDAAWILPARLLTLYRSADSLRRESEERAPEIGGALERMRGRYEWDLRVAFDPERLAENLGELSEQVAELDEEIADTTPGRGYLLGRVRDDRVRDRTADVARRTAEALLEELRPFATDVVRLELPDAAGERPLVLGAALLASTEDGDRLAAEATRRAEELEGIGLRVEITGPWAPYRFLGDREDVEDRAATATDTTGGSPGGERGADGRSA